MLDRDRAGAFLESFESFARRTALLGALNSLTQLVLKATMPGVPDFYQGTETWDLSLVDPDNRRPVDFAARQAALDASAAPDWAELAAHWTDGRIKLALTHRLLSLRNELPAVFRRWHLRARRGDRAAIAITSWRSAARGAATAWWSPSARHFARLTDNGQHWPDRDWQAELNLDRRHRQGSARCARRRRGGMPEPGHLAACSPCCRSRCCGTPRRFHSEPCARRGPSHTGGDA